MITGPDFGAMVDVAVLRAARDVLARADRNQDVSTRARPR